MHLNFRKSGNLARIAKSALFAALLVHLCPRLNSGTGAFAQSATTGAIGGTVTDSGGALLPAATITVKSVDTGAHAHGQEQRFRRIPRSGAGSPASTPRSSPPTASRPTRKTPSPSPSAACATVSPSLKLGSVADRVEVTDQAPLMHTEDDAISTTIDQNAIDNLPINGRRWSNFALLTPGVVSNSDGFGLLSFRGISVLLNNSTVDGADNNQAYFSEERGRTRALLLGLPGGGAGVSGQHLELLRRVWPRGRRRHQHRHKIRRQSVPWRALLLRPRQRLRRQQSLHPAHHPGRRTPMPSRPTSISPRTGASSGASVRAARCCATSSSGSTPTTRARGTSQARRVPPTRRLTFAAADPTLPAGTYLTGGTLQRRHGRPAPETRMPAPRPTRSASITRPAPHTTSRASASSPRSWERSRATQTRCSTSRNWIGRSTTENRFTIQYNRLRYSSPAGRRDPGLKLLWSRVLRQRLREGRLRHRSPLDGPQFELVNSLLFQYGRDFEYESSQTPLPNEQPISTLIPDDPLAPSAPPEIQIGYEFDGQGFDIGRSTSWSAAPCPMSAACRARMWLRWTHGKHEFKAGVESTASSTSSTIFTKKAATTATTTTGTFIADYLHATTGLGGAELSAAVLLLRQGFGNPAPRTGHHRLRRICHRRLARVAAPYPFAGRAIRI